MAGAESELELDDVGGAFKVAAGAAGTITGIGDCADKMQVRANVTRIDKAGTRILLAPASPSGGVDSRNPKVFRNRGELRVNLHLVLPDRDLLVLHLFDDRENLLLLLLDRAWSVCSLDCHEQDQ